MTTENSDHPFLNPATFVRWSTLRPESIVPDIRAALAEATARVDSIASQDPATATFESSFLALDDATEELSQAWGKVGHLDSVLNSSTLRTAHNTMLPEVSTFYSKVPLNSKLWQVLKTVASRPDVKSLTAPQRRLIEETMASFLDSGADLGDTEKARIEAINSELAEVTQKYSENVLDSTNAWEIYLSETETDGLPKSALAAARESAASKKKPHPEGKPYRFTLQAPSLIPVMKHLKDDGLREVFWQASNAIGSASKWDNTELLKRILELRAEKAELLGSNHFADWVLRRRMAQTGATALAFVEDLHGRVAATFQQECQQLESYRSQQTGQPEDHLQPWQVAWWAEQQRRQAYDLDEEQLRPYFPVDRVQNGMFTLAEKLFGIAIRARSVVFVENSNQAIPADAVEVWHPEVKCYDIFDGEEHLGSFYTDWHPRESKRGGAWMNPLTTGCPAGSSSPRRIPHLGVICGNLTPPVGGKPALLTHDDVVTIFHEFGHLLHHLLGNVEVRSLNGINVVWDFVELPSQILENWCWEKDSLDLFARHYETNEPIPTPLFEKMIKARNYRAASDFMRQLALAKLDLELHINASSAVHEDLDAFINTALKGYLMPLKTPQPAIVRRFTHLFASSTGYAAGYYSYKWAEVLDADAFTRFQTEGILNHSTGKDFRSKILAKGNSQPPQDLFRDFMGRDPDPNALLKRNGIE